MATRLFNRLETIGKVRGYVDKHYEWVRQYGEEGKPTVWVEGPCPTELWLAADIPFIHSGNFPARSAAWHMQKPFLEEAEAAGFSSSICSYCRIMIGLALLVRTGKIKELPIELQVPKPAFLFSFNGCPAFARTIEAMRDILDVPAFIIDCPYHFDAGNRWEYEWAMDYVERQLHEFISFLQKLTGRPFDWDRLRELLKNIQEEIHIRREIREMAAKAHPTPITFGDWLSIIALANILRGQPWMKEYLGEVREEVKRRVAEGVGSIPTEKHRLYWHNITIWYKTREITEYLARHNSAIVSSNYTFGFCEHSWNHGDFYYNPDRPLRAVAEEHATRHPVGVRWRVRNLKHYAQAYNVEGIIFHAPLTCRSMGANAWMILEDAKQELGIPGVVIEADHTDPDRYSKAQVEDRLETFVETLLNRE
ncbi:MAG TPA: 2-hydroxyacyl-CoA dehydratase [Dehalococcoidia bacterium]|nr:2-hydroxyacyl-CoA dehydratase [Dehalococcoidia bacterium]